MCFLLLVFSVFLLLFPLLTVMLLQVCIAVVDFYINVGFPILMVFLYLRSAEQKHSVSKSADIELELAKGSACCGRKLMYAL